MINEFLTRLDYIVVVILFCIGLYALTVSPNLIKKIIGLNIMESSVYLFFIALGDVRLGLLTKDWAIAPIVKVEEESAIAIGEKVMVNPIPPALILTTIVVSISVTSISLAIAVKLYEYYGTLNTKKFTQLKG